MDREKAIAIARQSVGTHAVGIVADFLEIDPKLTFDDDGESLRQQGAFVFVGGRRQVAQVEVLCRTFEIAFLRGCQVTDKAATRRAAIELVGHDLGFICALYRLILCLNTRQDQCQQQKNRRKAISSCSYHGCPTWMYQ